MSTPILKSILLFFITLSVLVVSVLFAVWHHDDSVSKINYALTNQDGEAVTQKDYAGKYQLVFFGFTSCEMICPTQMNRISRVMRELETTGQQRQITPIFVTVDPERDTVEEVKDYISHFHPAFVGLTGSRQSLKRVADSFQTLLSDKPDAPEPNYQIVHSSVVYIVDPFLRITDFISPEESIESITQRLKKIL